MNKKTIEKNIKLTHQKYVSLINTIYGSLIKSLDICYNTDRSEAQFVNDFKHAKLPYLNSDNFIVRVASIFGYPEWQVKKAPLVAVHSKWNTLFFPYFEENNELIVVPLNKEGTYPQTYYQAITIEKITWDNKEIREADDKREYTDNEVREFLGLKGEKEDDAM